MLITRALLGLAFFCLVAWLLSSDRRRVPWRVIAIGISAQFVLAGLLLGTGVLTAFLLFIVTNVVHAIGLGGGVPVALAAWTPAGVSLMVGIALLMHLEDG